MRRGRRRRSFAGAVWKAEGLPLLLLALCFFLGLLAGQMVARRMMVSDSAELSRYLNTYLADGAEHSASFLLSLFLYFRYPFFAFLSGFAVLGLLLLPLSAFAQAFFLSYSVHCFAAAMGRSGVLLAAAAFGLRCLVVLPCYFYIAVNAFRSAMLLRGLYPGGGNRTAREKAAWPLLRLGICVVLLFLGALLDYSVAPSLLRFAASIL